MIKYFCDKCNKEVAGLLKENVRLTPEDLYLREIKGLELKNIDKELCLECREIKNKLDNELLERQKLERENLDKEFFIVDVK